MRPLLSMRSSLVDRLGWTGLCLGFLTVRALVSPRGLDATGVVAIRDLALTLGLWCLVVIVVTAAGYQFVAWISPAEATQPEHLAFGFAIGAGSISTLIFGLALSQILSPVTVSTILLATTWWVSPTISTFVQGATLLPMRARDAWHRADNATRLVFIIVGSIGLATLINALSPPWGYDSLMYHLPGPRMFLDAGGLFPFPDNWYVNGPFNIEMLFSIGLAVGDDVFPKLVSLTFGVCYLLTSYLLASRLLPRQVARLAPVILLGIPIIPFWGSIAYIDIGWATFELVSASCLYLWWRTKDSPWLLMSGLAIGFACGSKYLGLIGLGLVTIALLALLLKDSSRRNLGPLLWFGLPVAIVAGPWYVKNLIWFGNPVFPLWFGGADWTAGRLKLYTDYLGSFGSGKTLLDYLSIPVNAYLQHAKFGTIRNSIDIPSLLFPLALGAPFVRPKRAVNVLLAVTVLFVGIWSIGSQQLRFLLPVYPLMAIAAAHVMTELQLRARRPATGMFLPALAVGLTFVTAYYQVVSLVQFRPLSTIIGRDSTRSFFLRTNKDYPAIVSFLESSNSTEKLLMLGDARSYLCMASCIPDPDHFRWAADIAMMSSDSELASWFADRGASHLLFSLEDLDFLLQHDPDGVLRQAVMRIDEWRESGCLQPEFSDEWAKIYAIKCVP